MSLDTQDLHAMLTQLHHQLRQNTLDNYQRLNPFYEDLFDWKERGEFIFGQGKNITLYNSASVIGDVEVGENTWIGPFCLLDGTAGIHIGKNCSISSSVQILTHDSVKWALSGGKSAYEYAPSSVGDCCFIGTASIILKGITIGNHCLIGAGSVVNKDLPNFSIAAGVPAKIIGKVIINEDHVTYEYFKEKPQ